MRKPIIVGNFTITLDGRSVPYTLKRSFTARLIWFSIRPRIGLCVTIPSRYAQKYVPDFLQSKSNWILKHLSRETATAAGAEESPPPNLQTVTYLGRELKIVPVTGSSYQSSPITLAQDRLLVSAALPGSAPVKPQIVRWLSAQAGQIISEKVAKLCQMVGVTCRKITIRNQRTRWGSCSRLKNLSFNWRIIMAPEPVLDYVVVHEVCHLQELSHSQAFWALVARHCPQWREHRRWLNAHTGELNAQFPD
jgi:predicted metal-dependent hydrolase